MGCSLTRLSTRTSAPLGQAGLSNLNQRRWSAAGLAIATAVTIIACQQKRAAKGRSLFSEQQDFVIYIFLNVDDYLVRSLALARSSS